MCNAGIGGYVALTNIDEAEFDRVMHTNVLGSYYTVQACLPLMGEGSTIILNTSVTASLGLPDFKALMGAAEPSPELLGESLVGLVLGRACHL